MSRLPNGFSPGGQSRASQPTALFRPPRRAGQLNRPPSNRYDTFKCRWLPTAFPRFTCAQTGRISSEAAPFPICLSCSMPVSSRSRIANVQQVGFAVRVAACPCPALIDLVERHQRFRARPIDNDGGSRHVRRRSPASEAARLPGQSGSVFPPSPPPRVRPSGHSP